MLIIVLFVCVALFTAAKKNKPLPPSSSSTESTVLSVGRYSIDKQKMTDCNVNEFFKKLDLIIGLFVDEIGENLHEGVVGEVTELRKLILGWEVKRDRTQIDQSQQKNVNEFFKKLDLIIGLFVDEIGENLHEGVVGEVTELRKLILGWEVKRDRTQIDQSQQKTADEIKLD